jgi:phosphoribosylformimino-5-aminoimidazole carboxamide ribonucleotide (ProFAR) isomerase
VGLESVTDPALLRELAQAAGERRAVFSLDLVDGHPRTTGAGWQGMGAAEIAHVAINAGFRHVLLLDVRRVGKGEGPTSTEVCEAVSAEYPQVEWSLGGGVRNLGDLASLERAGFHSALVSTALHRGQISPPK